MSHPRRRPNERRFEEYDEFIDRTGFKIKEDGQYISFYYDKYKGWFDEYGNYYNSDGRSTKPSKESLDFWHNEIKHIYIDPLLEDYDLGGSQSSDSYFDDHDDADYDDPEVIDEIIQHQNQTTIKRNEQQQQQPKVASAPQFHNSNKTQQSQNEQSGKQQTQTVAQPQLEKKSNNTQEEKKAPEIQPSQSKQTPTQTQNEGPRVYVSGLIKQKFEEFLDWLLKNKKVQQTWTSSDTRLVGEELKVKLIFPSKEEAETFVASLKPDNGKVAYKGKFSINFKVEA